MFEFGDELLIDSYRIPWLIWIQLLAMLLLVILLCYFTTTPSDLSIHFSTSTSASDPPSATALPFATRSFLTSGAANTRHNFLKVRENEINETGASTSELVQRPKKADGKPKAGSSTTNESSGMISERSHHPCHFFGFAKHAFLKCLGIDSTHEKDE